MVDVVFMTFLTKMSKTRFFVVKKNDVCLMRPFFYFLGGFE